MNDKYTYTLITGASEGIGRAIAENCARRGWNLILVALPGKELIETEAYLIDKYDVKVHSYGADLTCIENCKDIYEWISLKNYKINKLINNAGLGSSGLFQDISADIYIKQIQLNVTALSLLTRLLVEDLIANRPSYILNVGSLAGFCFIPYKSLYTATKSFVNTFSLSLKEELVDEGICVSALCPGPVATNDECRSRTERHGLIAKMSQTESAYVANKAINGMLAGKSVIIPGALNRFLFLLNHIIPKRIKFRMIKKEFIKELS